jgi:hypothetical protein
MSRMPNNSSLSETMLVENLELECHNLMADLKIDALTEDKPLMLGVLYSQPTVFGLPLKYVSCVVLGSFCASLLMYDI